MKRANHFNRDAGAEGIAIKRLINKVIIELEVERIQAYKEIRGTFQQNPGLYLISMSNKRDRLIHETIDN